jgi:hypothetical protein
VACASIELGQFKRNLDQMWWGNQIVQSGLFRLSMFIPCNICSVCTD